MLKKALILTLSFLFCIATIVFAIQSVKQKNNNQIKNGKAKTVNVKKSTVQSVTPDTTATKKSSPIVADYKGGVITRADVEERIAKIPAQYQPQYQTTQGMGKILDMMATEVVFYQKALKEGLDKDPTLIQKMNDGLKPLFMQEYYQRNIQKRVQISPADKETYYNQNKKKYFDSPNTTIAYLQTSDKKDADKAIAALRKGMSFAEAVKEFSTNKYSKELQGKIKNIRSNGYIPGVGNDTGLDSLITSAVADSTTLYGPYQTSNGFHIFKVMSRVPGRQKTFEEVAGDIENKIRPTKENDLTKFVVDSLKTVYQIKINNSVLDSLNQKNDKLSNDLMNQKLVTSNDPSLDLTAKDFLDIMKSLSPQEQMMFTKGSGKTQFLDQVLTRNLFAAEAKRLNYDKLLANTDNYIQTKRYVLLQQIYTDLVLNAIKITNEDKQQYYNQNKELFAIQPNRKIQQLTFLKEDEAKKMRTKYVGLLKKHKNDAILDMIRKSSTKPEQDGNIDNIYRNNIIPGIGTDSTYSQMVWKTPLNETSPVFKNSKGNFVFLTVLADNPITYRSFNEVEPRIELALKKDKEKEKRDSVTQDLKTEFNFKEYPERLEVTRTAKEYFDMADTAARNQKYSDAISSYDEIIKRYANGTDDYKAMFMKGFLLAEEMKKTDEAVKVFETFLSKYKQGELNESAKYMLDELKNGTANEEIPIKNQDTGSSDDKE
ncbi:MAG TPA: peptidyl-prolyl cis-trans isomerase [Candidatus Cloacimonadota bacterium]|nr:peptidyl-prolyl cis-trans isomerase [Candidatus Cloacimonadota bacterium]HPT70693.1 peptidyl-prolyl cis-trans isomerase [Candidatus Cloacimonadota bacterium]